MGPTGACQPGDSSGSVLLPALGSYVPSQWAVDTAQFSCSPEVTAPCKGSPGAWVRLHRRLPAWEQEGGMEVHLEPAAEQHVGVFQPKWPEMDNPPDALFIYLCLIY